MHFWSAPATPSAKNLILFVRPAHSMAQASAGTGIPFVAFQNPTLKADYYVSSFAEVERLPPFQELLAKEK